MRPNLQPGYLRHTLPAAAPEQPEEFEVVVADVKARLLPGAVEQACVAQLALLADVSACLPLVAMKG